MVNATTNYCVCWVKNIMPQFPFLFGTCCNRGWIQSCWASSIITNPEISSGLLKLQAHVYQAALVKDCTYDKLIRITDILRITPPHHRNRVFFSAFYLPYIQVFYLTYLLAFYLTYGGLACFLADFFCHILWFCTFSSWPHLAACWDQVSFLGDDSLLQVAVTLCGDA